MRAVVLTLLTALFAAGLLNASQTRNDRARMLAWVAPASANATTNPLMDRADVVAGGRKLFEERCSVCHGDDAQGTPRGPGLLKASVQSQSDGALFWKISSGNTRRGMPPFSFLPKQQRWQLVLHLRERAATMTH